jgi:quercetin dioxygenase-like cupin family protein
MIAAILSLLLLALQQDLPHAFPSENAKQIVDNERVTVWDVTWPEGKPSELHRHKYDLISVDLADASVRVTLPNGQSRTSSLKVGGIEWLAKGAAHFEESVGDKPRHAILIDLKDVKVPPLENKTGLPLAFPREGVRKLLENDRIIVWDYTWTPGKPTVMHFHDKDVVTIYMENGELKSTTQDGQVTSNPISFGDARFNPRNRMHSEELVKGKARAIVVELK